MVVCKALLNLPFPSNGVLVPVKKIKKKYIHSKPKMQFCGRACANVLKA